MYHILKLCAMLLFLHSTLAQDNLKLIFANMVWRHGARSSLHSFPTDPNNGKNVWPNGPGQLTQKGMKQQYQLGSFLRQRYGNVLLEDFYHRKEIYVRSTDVDRTLMSAQSNLAGLYPPTGKEMWNGSYTNWQPIPVHTVSPSADKLLRMFPYAYPEYNRLLAEIYSSEEYKNLNKMHANFLKNLSEWSGLSPMNISLSWSIQDPLACEKAQNLTIPEWATPRVMEELSSLAGVDMGVLFGGVDYQYREKLAPFAAGPLVKKVLENFDDKITNRTTYNVVAYSAHDTTVSAILVALKAYNYKSPPFASCVIFELYEDENAANGNSQYFVKAFYKNSTDTLHPLSLIGCDLLCPLDQLKQLAENVSTAVPTDSEPTTPTGNKILDFGKQHYLGVVLTVVILTLIITWLAVLVFVCKKSGKRKGKRNSNTGYQPISAYDEIPNGEI